MPDRRCSDLDLGRFLVSVFLSPRGHVRYVGVHRTLSADGAVDATVAPSPHVAVLLDENAYALETETVSALQHAPLLEHKYVRSLGNLADRIRISFI